MTSQLLVLDTRDDRREVATLLAKLPPRARVEFLRRCVSRLPPGKLPPPAVTGYRDAVEYAGRCDRADDRLTRMVYLDVLSLMSSFGLDAAATAVDLEKVVKSLR